MKLDQPQTYKQLESNEVLNIEYVGIGNLQHDSRQGNFENTFKFRLLGFEDKFYQSDLEIQQLKFLIGCIGRKVPKEQISRKANFADNFGELFGEDANLEETLESLNNRVV